MGNLINPYMGTRSAAQNLEEAYICIYTYREFMKGIGLVGGMSAPCIFYNTDVELRAVVHTG